MTYAIFALLAVIVIVAGFCATQYCLNQQKQQKKRDKIRQGADTILRRLEKNLSGLKSGNVHWRRIGHGKSLIGLVTLQPENGNGTPPEVAGLLEEHSDIAEQVERHDRRIGRMRQTADELADTVQGEVRAQYESDRAPDESPPIVSNLPQDGWILILQALINNGEFEDGLKGKIGTYWSEQKECYTQIMETKGGEKHKSFKNLVGDIREREEKLKRKMENIKRAVQAGQ